METKNYKMKVIGGALAGLLILSVGTISLASMGNAGTKGTRQNGNAMIHKQLPNQNFEQNRTEAKSIIDSLVSKGTLTQAQADTIMKAFMPAGKGGQRGFGGGNGNFIPKNADGTQMTPEQIKAKMDEQLAKQKANMTEALAKAVTNGTLTQEQSDKVLATIAQDATDKKAEQEKIAAMTVEQRKAYLEQNKIVRKPILASLVSDGTLTQEQANTIMKAIMPNAGMGRGNMGGMGFGGGRGGRLNPPPAATPAN